MKSTLNIAINTDLMALVQTSLQPDELASLFSALTALMTGEDASLHLNTSGLRLAFALLSSPIGTSIKRRATNRANGAKGGRPRKRPVQEAENQAPAPDTLGSPSVTAKKSKKEDLPPTPPIEEKNKKNLVVDVVDSRENENFEKEILNNSLRVEQACMSLDITPDEYRQMARAVLNDWEFTEESDRSYKHLLNSLRIKVREHSRQKRQCYGANSRIQHDITDTSATCAKDYEGPF